jgi:cyanophycinase-like exopeptidase
MKYIYLFTFIAISFSLQSQSYNSWIVGDTTDITNLSPTPGIILAGGAGDNDDAMKWMLSRADGGDVVVIRASNSDGYNSYFYSDLDIAVNSVQTIRFNNIAASTDPYVIEQIRNAECLFIAGGDQYDYYQLWKDTPIEDAINYLINNKGIPVGGTSAGMAILSRCYYTPSGGSLTANEALSNPYHPDYEIIGKDDFLDVPYTDNLIPDTHYDERDRAGRHVGMLARLATDYNTRSFGIASNEYTAVCIDENGRAIAFGEYPEFQEDVVYFLQANCQEEFLPETIIEGQALTWKRERSAVKVYVIPAMEDGSGYFDLTDWRSGEGGYWQNWYVDNGELFQEDSDSDDCSAIVSNKEVLSVEAPIQVFPNPVTHQLFLEGLSVDQEVEIRIYNSFGQLVLIAPYSQEGVSVESLTAGTYQLLLSSEEGLKSVRFIKID